MLNLTTIFAAVAEWDYVRVAASYGASGDRANLRRAMELLPELEFSHIQRALFAVAPRYRRPMCRTGRGVIALVDEFDAEQLQNLRKMLRVQLDAAVARTTAALCNIAGTVPCHPPLLRPHFSAHLR